MLVLVLVLVLLLLLLLPLPLLLLRLLSFLSLTRRARCVRRKRARPAAVRFRPRPLRLVLRGLGCERRRHGRQRRLLLAFHGAADQAAAGGELDAPPYPICFPRQPDPSLMLR